MHAACFSAADEDEELRRGSIDQRQTPRDTASEPLSCVFKKPFELFHFEKSALYRKKVKL